ncbi:teichoic acid transporter [Streptomyces sp. NPDC006984]|uniref:lipopolysaccharide biosynthesis protein n=1 Tax=Streptomyces sp. NPDC006984 TaxID=3155463 RepID=UPI0034013D91
MYATPGAPPTDRSGPRRSAPAARPLAAAVRAGARGLFSRDPLLRNGHLLAVSSLINAALGALFWVLATRWYDDAAVGLSYSALSAMLLLASIGQLNLSDFLIRFAPSAGRHTRRMVLTCYGVSAVASTAAAGAFLLLVPRAAPDLGFLRSPLPALCFVLATAAYAVFVMQDGALTALRRPGWVVAENIVFAVVKILLLGLGALLALATGILLSWAGALVVALLVANVVLLRHAVPRHERTSPDARPPARPVRYAAADYAGSLFRMAAYTLVPLIVLNHLGPEQSAYYSLAWVVAYVLYLVTRNLGSSLVVEAVRSPERLVEHGRRVMRHSALLLGAGVAVLVAGAPLILDLFGEGYSDSGANLLRLLALSALPNIVVSLAIDVSRARRRLRLAVGLQVALCVLVLGLTTALLPVMGITGAGVAWLAAECLLALPLLLGRARWLATGPADPREAS